MNSSGTSSATPEPQEPVIDDLLSPEERAVIVNDVEERVNDLLPPVDTPPEQRNFLAELELLGTELLEVPGVIATLISTTTLTVQVVMEDGISISIVNNRPLEAVPTAHSAQVEAGQVLSKSAIPAAVPDRKRAVVTNYDGGDNIAAEVRNLVSQAGYEVLSLGASLNDMMNYQDLGFFYIDTHGVQFQKVTITIDAQSKRTLNGGDFVYGLQSSTVASLANLSTYHNLLQSGEVILALGDETTGRTVKFAVTEKFIANHWTFQNGFVLIHACFGGAAPFHPGSTCQGSGCFTGNEPGVLDPSKLRAAMLAKGADTIVSFDNLTNTDYARSSMLFLLDRLLGSNSIQKVAGQPLRPFPIDEVRGEMGRRSLLSFYKPNKVLFGIEYGGGDTVNLTFDTKDSKHTLAPTIERVTVIDDPAQSEGELQINGIFATTQGEVTLGNVPAAIQNWSDNQIVVKTPMNGQGAAGEVLVKGPDSVESNPVPMTLWRGDLSITLRPNLGTLKAEGIFQMLFRADLHSSRSTINGSPSISSQRVYLNSDSGSRITASGTYVDEDGDRVAWGGGGNLDVHGRMMIDAFSTTNPQGQASQTEMTADQSTGFVGGVVTLDLEAGQARLCFIIDGGYDVNIEADGQSQTIPGFISAFLVLDKLDGALGLLPCVNMILKNDYSISEGSHTIQLDETTITVEWTRMDPIAPPDDQTPG